MTALSWDIKANFSGSTWTSIKADTHLAQPIEWSTGAGSSDPSGVRVAATGTLTFALKNGTSSSGGVVGYYSPDHASCRAGWAIGTGVRMELTSGGKTYLWKYYVADISPIPGTLGERYVSVTATDYMDKLASQRVAGLAIQLGQTSDVLYAAIVDGMSSAPTEEDWASGIDTFAYAFHDLKDERSTGLSALARVSASGLEYVYIKSNTTSGEVLTSETRHERLLNTTDDATLNTSMTGISIRRGKDAIHNTVTVTAHPVSVDTSAETILATLQKEIQIGAGATLPAVVFRYRDPDAGATRIAGVDIQTPVSGTDYKASSYSGGSGNDRGSDITMTVTDNGNNASVVFTETGSATRAFINFAQVRGRGIYVYDPIESSAVDSTSVTSYGTLELSMDCPYQDNPNVTQDFADWLLSIYKDPVTSVDDVTFCANTDATRMGYGCTLNPGDRVAITETVSGIADDYFINHITRRIELGAIMFVTLGALEYCQDVGDWLILDHATAGNLDQEKLGV